jgi:hypothetical protein
MMSYFRGQETLEAVGQSVVGAQLGTSEQTFAGTVSPPYSLALSAEDRGTSDSRPTASIAMNAENAEAAMIRPERNFSRFRDMVMSPRKQNPVIKALRSSLTLNGGSSRIKKKWVISPMNYGIQGSAPGWMSEPIRGGAEIRGFRGSRLDVRGPGAGESIDRAGINVG